MEMLEECRRVFTMNNVQESVLTRSNIIDRLRKFLGSIEAQKPYIL